MWLQVKDQHGAKARTGIVNAHHVVSVQPSFDRTFALLKDVNGNRWISEMPYDQLSKKLHEMKNKETQ